MSVKVPAGVGVGVVSGNGADEAGHLMIVKDTTSRAAKMAAIVGSQFFRCGTGVT